MADEDETSEVPEAAADPNDGYPELVMDLFGDLEILQRKKLTELGCALPANATGMEVSMQFFNTFRRRIEPIPRHVWRAMDFSCPRESIEPLWDITERASGGADLTQYLSRGINDPIDKPKRKGYDWLLNDWGIYHFHLGVPVEGDPFVSRTKELLYVFVTKTDFCMLGIRDHDDFAEPELLEILHKNFPEAISHWVPKGILVKPSDRTPTDRIANFRKAGLSGLSVTTDGTPYISPGGGYATAGNSLKAQMENDWWLGNLHHWEKQLREKFRQLVDYVRAKGVAVGPKVHFRLYFDDDGSVHVIDYDAKFSAQLYDPQTEQPRDGRPPMRTHLFLPGWRSLKR